MAKRTREQLLVAFKRGGTRSYAEAKELLEAWKFEVRRTSGGHAFWEHPRGVTLTIPMKRELKTVYRTLVIKKIEQIQLLDD